MADEYDYLFLITLLGDSGVGKSCFLLRYVEDTYQESYISTIGVDFKMHTIELDDDNIRLQIWDTCGQERFQTTSKSTPRNFHAFMLFFDVTDQESFDNIQTWRTNVGRYGREDNPCILIGTKCDMATKQVVDHRTAQEAASQMGIPYVYVSSKNSVNVDLAMREITRLLVARYKSTSRPSKSFPLLEKAMEQLGRRFGGNFPAALRDMMASPAEKKQLNRLIKQGEKGNTLLGWAVERNELNAAKLVLEAGGLVINSRDEMSKHGLSMAPIHIAAARGSLPLMHLLLEHGANLALETYIEYQTPLHLAAQSGHGKIVQFLLDNRCVATVKDAQQRTPEDLAAANGHRAIVTMLRALPESVIAEAGRLRQDVEGTKLQLDEERRRLAELRTANNVATRELAEARIHAERLHTALTVSEDTGHRLRTELRDLSVECTLAKRSVTELTADRNRLIDDLTHTRIEMNFNADAMRMAFKVQSSS